jgi:RNA polymerase sigma-B factor
MLPLSNSLIRETLSERELLERYHRHGDRRARDCLIERFVPLAEGLASRYTSTSEPQDDLRQVAFVGLVKAVDRFDLRRGTALSTYAIPTIAGELKRHFRDHCWAVRVPRDIQERSMSLQRASTQLCARLGRFPTLRELATEVNCTIEEALEAQAVEAAYATLSIDERDSSDHGDARAIVDILGAEDRSYNIVEHREALAMASRGLSQQEALALKLRFEEDMTQKGIARRMGVSQMQVSRLIQRALDRLRRAALA